MIGNFGQDTTCFRIVNGRVDKVMNQDSFLPSPTFDFPRLPDFPPQLTNSATKTCFEVATSSELVTKLEVCF